MDSKEAVRRFAIYIFACFIAIALLCFALQAVTTLIKESSVKEAKDNEEDADKDAKPVKDTWEVKPTAEKEKIPNQSE